MNTKNQQLFNQAQDYLVGGVNSPLRSFKKAGTEPLLLNRGKGAYVSDYDQKNYLDYVLCFGALILGHAHPQVTEAAEQQLNQGFGFGTTHRLEVELARTINQAIPAVEKIRFVNSGSEAVIGAIRLARAYTQKKRIVKFTDFYHGHAEYLFTDFLEYGNSQALDNIFKQPGQDIAAVIFEPVGGNRGVIPPDLDFLKKLRAITKKNRVLLIADEVITGFRFGFGLFSELVDIKPDLVCLGKIIGGGLPIGAYGGSNKIMSQLAPQGNVYQASTFAGNPVVMQAGIATLETLKEAQAYQRINGLTEYFCDSVKGHPDLEIKQFGSMFSFKFQEKALFRLFYRAILDQGIYFAPSEYEANFVSLAHSQADIEKTIAAVKKALTSFKKQEAIDG